MTEYSIHTRSPCWLSDGIEVYARPWQLRPLPRPRARICISVSPLQHRWPVLGWPRHFTTVLTRRTFNLQPCMSIHRQVATQLDYGQWKHLILTCGSGYTRARSWLLPGQVLIFIPKCISVAPTGSVTNAQTSRKCDLGSISSPDTFNDRTEVFYRVLWSLVSSPPPQ